MQTAELTRPAAIERARKMHAGGWSVHGITNYLQRNGVQVSWWTVKRWVDPTYAERERERQRDAARLAQRRKRGTRAADIRVVDQEAVMDRITALRGVGLSCEDAARVIRLDYGVPLTRYAVASAERDGQLPMHTRKAVAA